MKLIASKPFRYASRALVAGEPFEAQRSDARALVAIGRASYATTAATPEVLKVTEDSQEPESAGGAKPAAAKKAPKKAAAKKAPK